MVLTPEYTKTLNFKKKLKKPDECSLELFFEKIKDAIRSTDDGEKALRSMEYFHAGVSDGTLWEVLTALYFRWTCLPDCAVPELDADYRRNNRRLS